MGVIASKAALERSKVDPRRIDQVIFGNVLQTSGDADYLARHIGLKSGVPKEAPALMTHIRAAAANALTVAKKDAGWQRQPEPRVLWDALISDGLRLRPLWSRVGSRGGSAPKAPAFP